MLVLPDTNIWISAIRSASVRLWLRELVRGETRATILLSSLCRYELELGVIGRAGEATSRQALDALLSGPWVQVDFSSEAAVAAAQLAAQARRSGQSLATVDSLLAGHAVACGARFLTADRRLAQALPPGLVIAAPD